MLDEDEDDELLGGWPGPGPAPLPMFGQLWPLWAGGVVAEPLSLGAGAVWVAGVDELEESVWAEAIDAPPKARPPTIAPAAITLVRGFIFMVGSPFLGVVVGWRP